jgi:predicted PilT family ATPase
MINAFEVEHSEIDLRLQNDSAQAFESVEIAIEGNKLGAMLDCERGQVRVTGQVSSSANRLQEAAQNCCMIFTRMNDDCVVRS